MATQLPHEIWVMISREAYLDQDHRVINQPCGSVLRAIRRTSSALFKAAEVYLCHDLVAEIGFDSHSDVKFCTGSLPTKSAADRKPFARHVRDLTVSSMGSLHDYQTGREEREFQQLCRTISGFPALRDLDIRGVQEMKRQPVYVRHFAKLLEVLPTSVEGIKMGEAPALGHAITDSKQLLSKIAKLVELAFDHGVREDFTNHLFCLHEVLQHTKGLRVLKLKQSYHPAIPTSLQGLHFNNLRELSLRSHSVDSLELCEFLGAHQQTLRCVGLRSITLESGSWADVFGSLQQLGLQKVRFDHLGYGPGSISFNKINFAGDDGGYRGLVDWSIFSSAWQDVHALGDLLRGWIQGGAMDVETRRRMGQSISLKLCPLSEALADPSKRMWPSKLRIFRRTRGFDTEDGDTRAARRVMEFFRRRGRARMGGT